jgi:hypothetical protein
LAILTLIAAVATALGATPWPLILLIFLAALCAFAPRWGYFFAGPAALVVAFGGVLGALLLSAQLPLGILPVLAIVFGFLGLALSVVISRTQAGGIRRGRATWLELAAASTGLVVWLVALVVSLRVPTGERLGWLMRNDSMNNLILSHVIIRDTGVVLGPNANPVPLPAALAALGMIPGRPIGGPQLALAHDLAGMGWTWAALIGLLSVLAGLTVSAIVRSVVGSAGLASRLAAAGASLLVLSWYLTGFPIEFGFLNVDVALPLLLVSILLALLASRAPWIAAISLAGVSTLVLATWSPLALVPLALLAVTVLRYRGALWPRRRLGRILVALAALQLLLYALFGALPSLVAQGSALEGYGGIYAQNNAIIFVGGAAVGIVAFGLFRRARGSFAVFAVVVGASWVALGVLLFLNRNNPTPWTYYPVKLGYFCTGIFLLVGFGLAAAFVAKYSARRIARWGGSLVLALAVVVVVAYAPSAESGVLHLNPVARVTASHADEVLTQEEELVLAIAKQGRPALVWGTGLEYESRADLWLVQLQDDTLSGVSKLRLAGYAQTETAHTIAQLCGIARTIGPDLVVHTDNATLRKKFSAACPSATVTFAAMPKNYTTG